MTIEPDIDMGDSPTVDQSQDDLDIDAELTEDGKLFVIVKITGCNLTEFFFFLDKMFLYSFYLSPIRSKNWGMNLYYPMSSPLSSGLVRRSLLIGNGLQINISLE